MSSTSASLLERLCKNSDRSDWERFVDLYTPLLLKWCRQAGMSTTDAADFTQEVFVVLLEQMPKFTYDPSRSFRAWLKTILLNAWRKGKRRAAQLALGVENPDLLPDPQPHNVLEEVEHREHLVRRALTVMQKDFESATWKACWEFVVHGRSPSEVAAELGVTVNAVYLAKSRVLRRLRGELRGFLD